MIWEGREVVKTGRMILGATNPLASQPGTIRGDYAIVSLLHTCTVFAVEIANQLIIRTSAAMSATALTL